MRGTQTVKAALGLDAVSDHFLVELRPQFARRFAANCEGHGIAPKRLREMIRSIDKVLPRMDYGPNNPNTGHPFHFYKIGKEYSRVLYLYLVKAYFPNDFDFDALTARIVAIAHDYGPDEVCPDNSAGHLELRFWWD